MSDPIVALKGVSRSFGRVHALEGLELVIEPGSVVGFLGPNGAGKTTTLRILTGLLKPDAGSVSVFGADPWMMAPEQRRRIGYLSERDFPFAAMNLRDAAAFTSQLFPRWDGAYLDELVELLEVPTRIAYASLSRGQQRKFYLALTLAPRPELLLLDDPAQGLDVTVRRQFVQSIMPLLHEQATTVVFSSHIMSDVERIADQIAIVVDGRVALHRELDALKESVCQVLVPHGTGAHAPHGTLLTRDGAAGLCYTVLDADPAELRAFEQRDGVQVRSIGLEDIFVDVLQSRRGQEVVREPV